MRYPLYLIVLIFGFTSCDSSTDAPTSSQSFPVTGFIYATRDCESIVSLSGFTVSIEGTGLTAVTNDSGRYSFAAVPPGRYATKVTKETYWPATSELEVYVNGKTNLPYPYINGKSSIEARFVGDWQLLPQERQIVVDSIYTNSFGESVKTGVYRNILDTLITIGAEALDGGITTNNAALSAWVQKTSEFDYFDNSKGYLSASSGRSLQFSMYQMRSEGARSGETVYARVWANSQCNNGSGGYRISGTSGLKSYVLP